LAWLVKERNYIHHFAELAPGQEGIETGLKNLAAQIILAYSSMRMRRYQMLYQMLLADLKSFLQASAA